MDRTTGKVEVTAHNHGFAVDAPLDRDSETPYGTASVGHVCLNDDVVEGLEVRRDGRLVAFSVQYHPEAAAARRRRLPLRPLHRPDDRVLGGFPA